MSRWLSQHFTPASVDPEGNFLPGGLSATDVVLHHFRHRFAADPTLAAIFAGRIEVLNGPLPYDYQDFPRLQLYGDLTTEDERPTAKVIEGVQVAFAVRDEATFHAVAPQAPSVATLFRHIAHVVRQDRLVTKQIQGRPVTLARSSEAGTLSLRFEVVEGGARPMAVFELPWRFHISVDEPTGKIDQILRAGGYPS